MYLFEFINLVSGFNGTAARLEWKSFFLGDGKSLGKKRLGTEGGIAAQIKYLIVIRLCQIDVSKKNPS